MRLSGSNIPTTNILKTTKIAKIIAIIIAKRTVIPRREFPTLIGHIAVIYQFSAGIKPTATTRSLSLVSKYSIFSSILSPFVMARISVPWLNASVMFAFFSTREISLAPVISPSAL